MRKKIFAFSLCLIIFLAVLIIPTISSAQSSIIDSSSEKYEYGQYGLNDMLSIATWAAKWILGIVGSLTLLMFVYGGFILLTSAGSNEKVGEAKKIITAAVIGLIIVFSSAMIIRFVSTSLGLSWSGEKLETASSQNTGGTNKVTDSTCTNYELPDKKNAGSYGFSCVDSNSAGYCFDGLCPSYGSSIKCCAPKCETTHPGWSCTNNYSGKAAGDCVDYLCKGAMKCCRE